MSAASQARLGQSVMRKLANCAVTFPGGSVLGIISNLPEQAVLADTRVQARDIQIRLDASGLGTPIAEGQLVTVVSPLHGGNYRVAVEPVALPDVGHVIVALQRTR